MITSALHTWLRGWSTFVTLVIFLCINYLFSLDMFYAKSYAFGLNYNTEKASYSDENLSRYNAANVDSDIQHMISILEKWKTKNSSTAERESDGFMAYDEEEWQRLKDIHRAQSQRQRGGDHPQGSVFYQQNYEPTWSCPFERRVGNIGDGGKWVCDMQRYELMPAEQPCVVYSFGVRDDSSFEAEMHERTHCDIFAFDMTVDGVAGVAASLPRVTFWKMGLGAKPGEKNGLPVTSLTEIMKKYGHTFIDVLKIDVEYSEVDVIRITKRTRAI
jgi:hypothetical protein